MPAFVFRLETALRLRRHLEEETKKQLAKCISQQEIAHRNLSAAQQELETAIQEQRRFMEGTFQSDLLLSGLGWIASLKEKIAHCRTAVEEARQQVDNARSQMLIARRNVKVLETLRERRYQQWRHKENQRQENLASDLASIRWLNQQR